MRKIALFHDQIRETDPVEDDPLYRTKTTKSNIGHRNY